MLCSTVVLIMPHYESKSMPSQHESLFGDRQITKSISVSVSILLIIPIKMASCYNRPDLCNYYCSHKCSIGEKYVPEVEVTELPNIILETIASLNEINPLTGRLIQISRDGKITDDEIHNFALISKKLDEISLAIDSLNLWVDKTASDHKINIDLLNEEKKKLQ